MQNELTGSDATVVSVLPPLSNKDQKLPRNQFNKEPMLNKWKYLKKYFNVWTSLGFHNSI